MRFLRRTLRRPRPASVVTAAAAVIILGGAGAIGSSDATPADFVPKPDRAATSPAPAPATADLVASYNYGWKAGVTDLGDGTKPTYPNVSSDGNHPGTAWVDGWNDGQADALGDDNRDRVIDEDESGWDCRPMGNRKCGPTAASTPIELPVDCSGARCAVEGIPDECRNAGTHTALCATVAAHPPYEWTTANDGSTASNPDGRAMIRDLEEKPGTAPWADALRALDSEYREHAPRG